MFQKTLPESLACAHCNKPFKPRLATSKYCSRDCLWGCRRRKPNPKNYQGARTLINGYIFVRDTERGKAIQEHRKIMESILKRRLLRSEVVHHINGITTDNRPENLALLPTQAFHLQVHKYVGPCKVCGKKFKKQAGHGMCKACHLRDWRKRRKAIQLKLS